MIKVRNLEKKYQDTLVLKNINMTIENGEFVAIMGASGSGKTTLLNCISTIDIPTNGEIFYNDKNISSFDENELSEIRSKNLAFVFQDYNLLDKFDVFDNIALKLTLFDVKYDEIQKRVEDVAKQLKLTHILHKYPHQISGGEKQRVAIARALIGNPSILIGDEPTGALDSVSSETVMELMRTIHSLYKVSILLVTHSEYVASYADRVIFIKDGSIEKELLKDKTKKQKEFYEEILNISKDGIGED